MGVFIITIYKICKAIWRCGVVVITTAQLHSTKPELKFKSGNEQGKSVNYVCQVSKLYILFWTYLKFWILIIFECFSNQCNLLTVRLRWICPIAIVPETNLWKFLKIVELLFCDEGFSKIYLYLLYMSWYEEGSEVQPTQYYIRSSETMLIVGSMGTYLSWIKHTKKKTAK